MTKAEAVRDCMWRWQTGGKRWMSDGQTLDATLAFDFWLRKHGQSSYNGVPVDTLDEFINAIQECSVRACGLEGFHVVAEPGTDQPEEVSAALGSVNAALTGFIAAYRAYDEHFECLKVSDELFAPLGQSKASLEMDRAAWFLSEACLTAQDLLRRHSTRMVPSPLRHAFLAIRTLGYIKSVFLTVAPDSKPPACPFHGDPILLHEGARLVLTDWLKRYAAEDDTWRRAQEAHLVDRKARVGMIRWLEAMKRFDEVNQLALDSGQSISASGHALTENQRIDLRALRKELMSFTAARNDIAKHKEGRADLDEQARRNISTRLEEMRDYHKSKATFLWVRSFHFDAAAKVEASLLAPRLMQIIMRDIEPDASQKSGDVGQFIEQQASETKSALGKIAESAMDMADDRHEASATGKKALDGQKAGALLRAAKKAGGTVIGSMFAVVPALAKQVLSAVDDLKPTPLEKLARKVQDWRVDGVAQYERKMRRAESKSSWGEAKISMIGYARATAADAGLMKDIGKIDPDLMHLIRAAAEGRPPPKKRNGATLTIQKDFLPDSEQDNPLLEDEQVISFGR